MSAEIILNNTFFAFWYLLGEYFLAIWGVVIFFAIFLALYYLIIKR